MYCSYCAHPLVEDAIFCINCGKRCAPAPENASEIVFSDPEAPATHSAVSPRNRRAVLVPVVIMAVLFALGLGCFLLMPDKASEPQISNPTAVEMSQSDNHSVSAGTPGSLPVKTGEGNRSKVFIPADVNFFEMTDQGIRFLHYAYDGGKVLVVPNEIDGVPVTAIADAGFAELEGITTVILPDTLETIGKGAFAGSEELRGVYFPETVKSIGADAFEDCIRLESICISDSMESIGKCAFSGCASLRFIFYSGTYEQWRELYNEYVTPFTYACCSDGEYYHGVVFQ